MDRPETATEHYAVRLRDVTFAYSSGQTVLSMPQLAVARGERIFVFGPSGSGKTTLLGLLAGVLLPSSGSIEVLGRSLATLSGPERDAFRARHIGYIFQMFNLIPYLSVEENIGLPARLSASRAARISDGSIATGIHRLADRLGISTLLRSNVMSLSVGQQQRVAAARALLGNPEIIIADEPTSALDADHRHGFLQLLFESCTEAKSTLVFVSHDLQLEPQFDRSVSLVGLQRVTQS